MEIDQDRHPYNVMSSVLYVRIFDAHEISDAECSEKIDGTGTDNEPTKRITRASQAAPVHAQKETSQLEL